MSNPIPDFTKLTWQLNIALAGAIFAVFALIYNENYIEYGFVTFLFGVLGHFLDNVFSFLLVKKTWRLPVFYGLQTLLMAVWLAVLALIHAT